MDEMMELGNHIEKMVLASQVISGVIMGTFITRDRKLMIKRLNLRITNKIKLSTAVFNGH